MISFVRIKYMFIAYILLKQNTLLFAQTLELLETTYDYQTSGDNGIMFDIVSKPNEDITIVEIDFHIASVVLEDWGKGFGFGN